METVIVAVLGLITTATAPALTGWFSSKRERVAWRRGHQSQAYGDAMAYAEVVQKRLDLVTDPYPSRRTWPETEHIDLITARLRLFGDPPVVRAWLALIRREEIFDFEMGENFGHLLVSDGATGEAVPTDEPTVVALQAALRAFRDAAAAGIGRAGRAPKGRAPKVRLQLED
ncbi:hypothetical protein [Modestobacter sp. SYSU DS0290]